MTYVGLTHLDLSFCGKITDETLVYAIKFEQLVYLNLKGNDGVSTHVYENAVKFLNAHITLWTTISVIGYQTRMRDNAAKQYQIANVRLPCRII